MPGLARQFPLSALLPGMRDAGPLTPQQRADIQLSLARGAEESLTDEQAIQAYESILQQDPASGHLFVFVNRRRDMLKILHWDGSGFWIWYRRLERGTFQLPTPPADHQEAGVELTPAQLSLILDGIDLKSVRQRLRYRHADRLAR